MEEAAWQLAEEVSGRRRDPVRARRHADPLGAAVLLPPADRALHRPARSACSPACPPTRPPPRASRSCPTCPATCAARGRRVPAGDARALPDCALQAFLGAVWGDATDFVFDAERFAAAYAELEEAAYGGCELSRRAHAGRGPRDRVRRGAARGRASARARDDAGRRARRAAPTTRTPRSPCSRSRLARRGPRAGGAGRRLRRLQTALRLWDDAEPALGPTAWARTDGARGWPSRSPPACAARPATACSTPRRRTRCARSAASSSRRTPRAGELAWALRRFELGCERGERASRR